MCMRRVGLGGSQAPCAAAGEVRSDPFPLGTCVLCVDLNGPVGVFVALYHGHFFDSVGWKQALLVVAVQLGSVWALWAFDGSFFG